MVRPSLNRVQFPQIRNRSLPGEGFVWRFQIIKIKKLQNSDASIQEPCAILKRSLCLYYSKQQNSSTYSRKANHLIVEILQNAMPKYRYLKKLTYKGTLRQVFFLSEAPSPPMTPYFPPYILFTCIQYYSHREGGRGKRANQRKDQRDNGSQSWSKNTNMTDCISSL